MILVGYGVFKLGTIEPIRTVGYQSGGSSKIYKKEGTAKAVCKSHPGTIVRPLYIVSEITNGN